MKQALISILSEISGDAARLVPHEARAQLSGRQYRIWQLWWAWGTHRYTWGNAATESSLYHRRGWKACLRRREQFLGAMVEASNARYAAKS